MAESDGQERTEQATPKREQEAREKGQVPRSRELGTVAALLAAATGFMTMGESLMTALAEQMRRGLSLSREQVFDATAMPAHFLKAVVEALLTLMPFFALMVVVAIAASAVLGGWAFSALSFKWEKLDPIKGMGRVFAWRGLIEMLKGMAKFMLVSFAALLLLQAMGGEFLGLGRESLPQGLAHMGNLLLWAFLLLSATLLVVVLIDVPFQLWDHQRQLRMTKQEVRDEHKQTEGSPEVKGRIRRMQMEIAQRRMMAEVPKADVVVTNPSHYAVALRYDQSRGDAPVVVAKGADLIALKIRTVAQANDVPVLEAPPLARALYHSTELEQPIPVGLYRAVAMVLAYVYHLRQGPVYNREGVVNMPDLPIPDDLRRDE
ncbi:MAG: flagellar biosynthesis protein FlhB [Gammaproteobacteria bacterium HGW-Gammaproteobacteria-1]|jgi:flagellar biosynthetic protein FlhB|nr:MAG: flagellar biosynthesis protein FlhB [Gammaproteobacteria bacterium HGW-Gammaproteobacteria-1]